MVKKMAKNMADAMVGPLPKAIGASKLSVGDSAALRFVDALVRAVPHTGMQCAILALVFGGEPRLYLTYLATYLVSVEFLSHATKRWSGKIGGTQRWSLRPDQTGTSHSGTSTSCGVYSSCGKTSSPEGFFSGHCAAVCFNLVFWGIHIKRRSDMTDVRKALAIGFLFLVTVAVVSHRLWSQCHNLLQVLTGCAVGSALGYVSYDHIYGGDKKMSIILPSAVILGGLMNIV